MYPEQHYLEEPALLRLSDGNWFGVYGHYHYNSSDAYSGDSPGQPLIMLAYTGRLSVRVRANYAASIRCGMTVNIIWNNTGDYIHVLPGQ